MPPRYAYWTILVDEQPTAFRAGAQEDLMPTFKRLKEKHPSARMVWFQNGKVWNSRLDAQEAMRARGEMGRRGDARQYPRQPAADRPDSREPSGKLTWTPKSQAPRSKPRVDRPEWKPKGASSPSGTRFPASGSRQPSRAPAASGDRRREGKLEWTPRGEAPTKSYNPKTPKPRGFKGQGSFAPRGPRHEGPPREARGPRHDAPRRDAPRREPSHREAKPGERRDKNWRPGGEHRDPRQKYKDAKKAKWTRFKQTIRKRWEGKQGKKKGE